MQLNSSAFPHNGIIPSRYTCEGANVNPPLEWTHAPAGAKSFALVMDDPDVPKTLRPDGMWDHWIVFNIPPSIHRLAENARPPGVSGKTTFGRTAYGGPCPPDREHRYFFKLYALDAMLDIPEGASKKELEKTMEGRILAEATLMGRYEKGKGY